MVDIVPRELLNPQWMGEAVSVGWAQERPQEPVRGRKG